MDRAGSFGASTVERPRVLAVDDDRVSRAVVEQTLDRAGLDIVAVDVDEAVRLIDTDEFDLVICDGTMPGTSGFEFLNLVRSRPRFDSTPFMFVTSASEPGDILSGLRAGADDYITKPFEPDELAGRVTEHLKKTARNGRSHNPIVDIETFTFSVERELARVSGGDRGGVLAVINIPNLALVGAELGEATRRSVLEHAAGKLDKFAGPLDVIGVTKWGDLAVLMPSTKPSQASDRLRAMAAQIARLAIAAGDRTVRLIPTIGFADFKRRERTESSQLYRRAVEAARDAGITGDLQPRRWIPRDDAKKTDHHPAREMVQVAATFLIGIALPFFVYSGLYELGIDISWPVYLATVVALVLTGVMIWTEGFAALRHPGAPVKSGSPDPPASAIICAYLPNEADTIVETIEHFLSLEYKPGLQVILAYNTPRRLPVELELQKLAEGNPNLVLLHVESSNSKAQNVNAAIGLVTGKFVGVFDADHHPESGSMERAWRWLSNGYDIVQGHCLVRNPEDSFLSKMVAIEFESIYGTNHPGRWMRDGFGIFGGSNGYWRSEALHIIRMRGSMLTEDIDSSMRLLEGGGKIASDPLLISRELATTTSKQIWNQRLRWAQGWTQVSVQHMREMLRVPHFNGRQRFGVYWLLFHREIYPWLSLQIFPLMLFWWARGDAIDWLVPVFLAATIFTVFVGPGMTFISYRLSHESLKKPLWFWQYALFGVFFYTEAKNVISRVAHLKELLGESSWRVTPRSADPGHGSVLLPGEMELLRVPGPSSNLRHVTTTLEVEDWEEEQAVPDEPVIGPEYFTSWRDFAAVATPGLSSETFGRALNASKGDAVKMASATIGLGPLELSMVSFHLWGKSFRQERNERAMRYIGRKGGPGAEAAAKEQMTTSMLSEIGTHLRGSGFRYLGPRLSRWALDDSRSPGRAV